MLKGLSESARCFDHTSYQCRVDILVANDINKKTCIENAHTISFSNGLEKINY
jgi:hypothetical protein